MMDKANPLYLDNTPGNILFSWAGVVANMVAALWCCHWLIDHHGQVAPPWYLWVPAGLLGLFLLDWFSALVHWAYDTWFDEGIVGFQRSVCIAREHHVLPYNIVGYGLRDHVSYSSWPALVLVAPLAVSAALWSPVTLASYLLVLVATIVCLGMVFGSHCHIIAHRPTRSRLIRRLQAMHLLITPAYHRVHHSGGHDVRYAIVNGWSNWLTDRIGFWRGLEAVITALTGAQPRRSDHEWMRRYGKG